MYEVVVETGFTAAHRHGEGLHGHDFRVLLTAGAEALEADVVVDFHALKQRADAILAEIAYSVLNENVALSEHGSGPAPLARWLFGRLDAIMPEIDGASDRRLLKVEVWDTPTSGASFSLP